jgi:hypothetical protein
MVRIIGAASPRRTAAVQYKTLPPDKPPLTQQ